jgi:hypothetical protein
VKYAEVSIKIIGPFLLNLQEKFTKKVIFLINLSNFLRFIAILTKLKQKNFKEG